MFFLIFFSYRFFFHCEETRPFALESFPHFYFADYIFMVLANCSDSRISGNQQLDLKTRSNSGRYWRQEEDIVMSGRT